MEAIISGMIESIICNPFAGSAGSPADFYFVTLQVFYHVKSLISVVLIFTTQERQFEFVADLANLYAITI